MAFVTVRQCDVFGVKNDSVYPTRVTIETQDNDGTWSEQRQLTIDLGERAYVRMLRFVTKGLSKPGKPGEASKEESTDASPEKA